VARTLDGSSGCGATLGIASTCGPGLVLQPDVASAKAAIAMSGQDSCNTP
jgi:hypothetical protein